MNQLSKGVLHDKTQVFREAYRSLKCAGIWDYLKRPTHYNGNDWMDACQLLARLRIILGTMGILRRYLVTMAACIPVGYLNRVHADIRLLSDGCLVRAIRAKCADCGLYSAILKRYQYHLVYSSPIASYREGQS